MTIEDFAKKLGRKFVLTYEPKVEHISSGTLLDNPEPWSCRPYDHSGLSGNGVTPEEACAALGKVLVMSAQERLRREAYNRDSAAERLVKLAKCGNDATDKHLCMGCGSVVCDDCGEAPWGKHRIEDHHKPCDLCGERVEDAGEEFCEGCRDDEDDHE